MKNSLSQNKILLFYIICYCYIDMVKGNDSPRISGDINMIGKWMKTQKNNDIMAFLGIPYAKPPVGDLRFRDPVPAGKFDGIFNATKDSDFCPQIVQSNANFKMSEDCLRLNVYTRNITGKYPVVFYIHGGQFLFGGGQSYVYGPQYMLDKDIVLVTINYRLGPLGFLSTKTADATGNYGLKDQVLALEWVRDNIKHFGGDPQSVTIFGQSAGAWSVSAHLVSPMSKGLFHRAIAFSGSTTASHFIDNYKWTKLMAKNVSCDTETAADMVQCMRNLPWEKLLAGTNWRIENYFVINFHIEIEQDFGQKRFLTEHPSEAISKGNFHKVPIIMGTTKDEFDEIAHVILSLKPILKSINDNFEKWAPILFTFEENTERSKDIAAALREFYFKNKDLSSENIGKISEIFSDSLIIHSVHRLMQLSRKYVDVYFYRFDYKGRFSCGSTNEDDIPNFISHSDDISYVFLNEGCAPLFNVTDPEQFMVERYNNWIYNFAKNGNPNGNNDADKNCGIWQPSNATRVNTLYNNETCTYGDEPYQSRMEFWDKLFPVKSSGNILSSGFIVSLFSLILIFTKNMFIN